MEIRTLGIDLGKTSFHAVGFDGRGSIVMRRRFSRPQLLRYMATLPPCLVGMEACCGAHHLGARLVGHGHDVRLMPPQYVRPFVKAQKNDYLDAEAIGEAVQRPTMRFVPLKTTDQLDLKGNQDIPTKPRFVHLKQLTLCEHHPRFSVNDGDDEYLLPSSENRRPGWYLIVRRTPSSSPVPCQ